MEAEAVAKNPDVDVLPALQPMKLLAQVTDSDTAGISAANEQQEDEQQGGGSPLKEDPRPATIIHGMYTEERFLDPDGGNRMVIYLPVARDGASEGNSRLAFRKNLGRGGGTNKKVAFANAISEMTTAHDNDGYVVTEDEYSTRDDKRVKTGMRT